MLKPRDRFAVEQEKERKWYEEECERMVQAQSIAVRD